MRLEINEVVWYRSYTGGVYVAEDASVLVKDSEGNTVTLYDDPVAGSPIPNPTTTDENGRIDGPAGTGCWIDETDCPAVLEVSHSQGDYVQMFQPNMDRTGPTGPQGPTGAAGSPWYNVVDFGAVPGEDCTQAFTDAFRAAQDEQYFSGTPVSSVVYVPPCPPDEPYLADGTLVLYIQYGFTLLGSGPGIQGTSHIQLQGGEGNLLYVQSGVGVNIEGIRFTYTDPEYRSDLVYLHGANNNDLQRFNVRDCHFAYAGPAVDPYFGRGPARSMLRLDRVILGSVVDSNFSGADNCLKLGPGYTNVIQIQRNTFNNSNDAHILLDTNDGENIVISENGFEAGTNTPCIRGGRISLYPAKSSNYTIGDLEDVTRAQPSSGVPITATLPSAVGRANRRYTVWHNGHASTPVTLACTGGETIDGNATRVIAGGSSLATPGTVVTVMSDGANWVEKMARSVDVVDNFLYAPVIANNWTGDSGLPGIWLKGLMTSTNMGVLSGNLFHFPGYAAQTFQTQQGSGAQNEIATLRVVADAGSFTLTLDRGTVETTTALDITTVDADDIQAALEALPNIGAGNVVVTDDAAWLVNGQPGRTDRGMHQSPGQWRRQWRIEFQGALALTNLNPLTADTGMLTGAGVHCDLHQMWAVYGNDFIAGDAVFETTPGGTGFGPGFVGVREFGNNLGATRIWRRATNTPVGSSLPPSGAQGLLSGGQYAANEFANMVNGLAIRSQNQTYDPLPFVEGAINIGHHSLAGGGPVNMGDDWTTGIYLGNAAGSSRPVLFIAPPFSGTYAEIQLLDGAATPSPILHVQNWQGGKRLGFYGATPVVKPTVTGSRGGNAALASLLTALANLGLIVDSTTA